jgi:putative aldouronate transport system permease protein
MVMATVGKKIHRSKSDLVFDITNYIIMTLFLFIMAYPLYYTLIASFSDIKEIGLGKIYLLPRGFSLEAYKNIFLNSQIWRGYRNTILYTLMGTVYELGIMLPLAYALSKKSLFGYKTISWFFLITMFFSGGLIPTYLLMQQMSLINNPLVMIIGSLSVYNMIVTRTFFASSIPDELYTSAKIDGANEFVCFFRIALPLSGAIIAVMGLFIAVTMWNSYFRALIYLTKPELYPLQLVLRGILILNQEMMMDPEFGMLTPDEQQRITMLARLAESMKFAVIYIASAPLLIAYPFIQKFFVKGIMIGSLKG